jgi:hypothetical protein
MPTPAGLPPIFEHTPVEWVPSQIIAEFPPNTFLESIAIAPNNTIFITSHLEGKIFRIEPNQDPVLHAEISGKATGLAVLAAQDLLMTGWDQDGVSTVYQVSFQGDVKPLLAIPEAMFLNGLTCLAGGYYAIADSFRGALWEFDAIRKTASIWLEHPLLARSSDREFPAANGVKGFKGALYVSNTEKQHIVRIPILENALPGEPEIFVDRVNVDDFAFDRQGNLYGATHIYNSVIKITPEGNVSTIAQAEQGMAGSTALAFGADDERRRIYVVTNGGLSYPLPTGIETAKVVRLDVDGEGLEIV